MMCILALWEDAVLKQRGDVHDGTAERCCPDDSEMICMVGTFTEDSGMMCMVAMLKDAVLRL